MSWAAVAVGAGSIVSGIMGSSSAKKAARAQAAAIREATALQREMYNTTRKDLSQYRDVGGKYLGELDRNMPEMTKTFTMSDFAKDPGYDFRMQEGAKALERSAAARGGLMGGAAGKAMARYGQDYASNEYSNAYNRFNNDRDQRYNKLSQMANMGQSAAAMTGQAGQKFAEQAGANIVGGGDSQAASIIAGGKAWSNAAEGLIGAGAMYARQNKLNTKPTQFDWSANNYQPTSMSEMIKRTA